MKLFSKEIDKKLFSQYSKGSDLDNQVVVTKIFNPYGNGRWFLLNSDPQEPDYLWAIVQMGDVVEMGSVLRSELESVRVSPFRFPLERDLSFRMVNAGELFRGLQEGKFYKKGGFVNGYKKGGETEEGVDLFEDYENIPQNVQNVLDKYSDAFDDGSYKGLSIAKKELEKIGYTFEYDLGGGAYDLRKIGEKGKNEDEYAKGGTIENQYEGKNAREVWNIWNYDQKFHFLTDHYSQKNNPFGIKFSNLSVIADKLSYDELPKIIQLAILDHIEDGQYAKGGELNLGIRKIAEQESFTPKQLGKDYELVMAQAIVESLTDANFHNEARKLISLLENKPEWENKPEYGTKEYEKWEKSGVYNSKYWDADEKTRDFAIKVSQKSGWDGYAIASAFEYLVRIDGGYHKLADKIEKAMESNEEMAKGGGIYTTDSLYYLQVIKDDKEVAREKFRAKSLKEAKEISEEEYESNYISKYGNPLNFIVSEAMAEGGEVVEYKTIASFDDSSIIIYDGNLGYSDILKLTNKLPKKLKIIQVVLKDSNSLNALTEWSKKQVKKTFNSDFEEGFPIIYSIKEKGEINIQNAYGELKNGKKVIFDVDGLTWEEGEIELKDGGEIDSEAKRIADNPNWTNDKIKVEYDSLKKDLQNFNNGLLKPSKVIGTGYKSSAIAKRLAKEWLEKNIATYKKALEIRGVMAKGGKLIGNQKKLDVNKNGKLDAQDFKILRKGKMAMGGETKFKDKVQSIKASLLKRKKVSPSVQKDYGKTYSPKEAKESAQRIAGSMVSKMKEKVAKSKKK